MKKSQRFNPRTILGMGALALPPHAFAFNDDPEGDSTDAGAPETTSPAAPPAETQGLTQDQVNRIIQDRLARERQTFQSQLEQLGFQGGLDGLKQSIEQQRQEQIEKLEQAKQYKELYERVKQEKDQLITQKEQELVRVREAHKTERVQRELTSAAAGAINPDQVVALVRDRVKVEDDGTMFVVDELGSRMTDGKGNLLTPRQYVERFLEANPHFKPASPGSGGNSRPTAPTAPKGTGGGAIDMDRAANDMAYFNQHRDAIRRMIENGEIIV